MKSIEIFLKKNAATILSIIGSIGVVGTAVLAVKATPKALKAIELEKKYPTMDDETLSDSIKYGSLTKSEIIKASWKLYIPSILVGATTIGCIFGSNYINKKNQKELVSAYILLHNTYLRYRESSNRLYGNDAEKKIMSDVIKSQDINNLKLDDEELLFFDMQSMRYFNSTMEKVKEAEQLFNEHLSKNGYAYLNDLYDLLGLEHVDCGYQLGWSTNTNDKLYAYSGVNLFLTSQRYIIK